MFYCAFCPNRSMRLSEHLQHRSLHSNLTTRYWCGFNKCRKGFSVELSLRSHVRRTHTFYSTNAVEPASNAVKANTNAKYICGIALCKKEYSIRNELISHLKQHIRDGKTIKCPHEGCDKTYAQISSFTSHMSKNHRTGGQLNENPIIQESSEIVDQNMPAELSSPINIINEETSENEGSSFGNTETFEVLQTVQAHSDPFLLNWAQLYLKLESHFLIPSTTIQHIFTESLNLHQQCQHVVKDTLRMRLANEGLTQNTVNDVCDEIFHNDPFLSCSDALKTGFKRKSFYKKEFAYVEPIEVCIEKNDIKNKVFHYVPLLETLKNVFSDKSFENEINIVSEVNDPVLLRDFTDGSIFQNLNFFKENPDALKLILYQDSFEVVNPLGSAAKTHKILAVYLSIGNLSDYARSHINSIKLVALCKEKDFDHNIVYGRIIQDLKIIETEGIELVSGKRVKGALVFIAGDNLGSHQLGGFVTNFSTSKYFCRYCLITRDKLQDEHCLQQQFESRTVEQHNEAIKKIGRSNDYEGVKFDSVFNTLKNYHVCMPGLAPCLGHDLLEGIVAYDLKLYIDKLVEKEWISYVLLNERIESFQYSITDRKDKPCLLSANKKRIVGGAWQVWMFLRLLPLLIFDKIKDPQSQIWISILLLTEIVEITISPGIHRSVVQYLSRIITEYLSLRLGLEINLRPKHHFLTHYPQLIIQYGPLMKVWTMRFESKHTYFKRALRSLRNYINVTKSMAEKHELHQSLLRCGVDRRLVLEMKGNVPFNPTMYNDLIQAVWTKKNLSDRYQQCDEIIMKGTLYKRGDALFISQSGYQFAVVVGRILLLLCDEENVFIIFEVLETVFCPHLRTYQLGACRRYECLPLDTLPSTEALHVYKIGNTLCVKPTYGLVRYDL